VSRRAVANAAANDQAAAEMPPDPAAMPAGNGHDIPAIPAGNGKGKIKLLTRQALDGRTKASRDFDSLVRNIARDISGGDESRISTIQWHLIEAFASIAVCQRDQNARMLLSQQFDLLALCQTVTTMVRVASRLPHGRVAKDVTPTLGAILRDGIDQQRERDQC
jgi:hypothetical protein